MKLLNILEQLDRKTLERASLFVKSPYHNTNKKATLTFEFIRKNISKKKQLTKEAIWLAIHPDRKYNDGLFRKMIHELLKIVESFFAHEIFGNDRFNQLRAMSKYCEKNDMIELKSMLQKEITKASDSDIPNSVAIHDLLSSKRFLNDTISMFEKKKSGANLSQFLKTLDLDLAIVYLVERLQLILTQKNYLEENLLDVQVVDIELSEKEIEKIGELQNSNPLIKAYYNLYEIRIKNKGILNISEIIKSLNTISKSNLYDATEIYHSLYTDIAKKLNKGKELWNEWFELSKFGLESGILIKTERIDPIFYRNIILAGCRTSEYSWALDFAEKYKVFLSQEYQQSAYSFNKARIFMNMKRYGDAVDMLRDVEYEDVTYNINSKLMLTHAFYELEEYEVLESTIKAFKIFLRRRRNISKARKANFVDHCDIVYNIIKAEERRDPKRIKKAHEILKSNSGIPNKEWLRNKIAEVSKLLGIKEEDPVSQ